MVRVPILCVPLTVTYIYETQIKLRKILRLHSNIPLRSLMLKKLCYCHIQHTTRTVMAPSVTILQGAARNVIPFYLPIKIVTSQYRGCKRASECCSSWKIRQMSPVCKMADNGRLTVDQKVKVVLLNAETKSVVATQETISYTLWYKVGSLQTNNLQTCIRNNFPAYEDSFCTSCQVLLYNKNVLCVQSMV